MGQTYNHLSLRERVEIELLRSAGHSLRRIGRALGRSAATISRELRRNAKPTKHWRGVYEGERAHALAQRRRRWDARFKLARQPALRALVRQSLAMGHSPEQMLSRLPEAMRRSLTFDNGTEFALHHRLRETLGLPTFFCDPHAPWQKGGIENAIGRLRRRLPRKADLAVVSPGELSRLAQAYNTTPRKCLAFHSPHEVFSSLINRVAPQP